MLGCKPAPTPSDSSIKLHADEGAILPDPSSFRRLIGQLLYLTNTRPDINFVVQQLSQFVSSPRESHKSRKYIISFSQHVIHHAHIYIMSCFNSNILMLLFFLMDIIKNIIDTLNQLQEPN